MNLHYKTFGSGFPLIILHGLMGSLDNWQTIAKQFSKHFQVYLIDLRNHGRSPHTAAFDYDILVKDLVEFYEQHHILKANIIGHSMGGKTAMQFALENGDKVEKLIVVDVAPVAYEDRHSSVFKALFAVDLKSLQSRQEAEAILRTYLDEESTVQFLMKGLYRKDNNEFDWRFDLVALYNAYQNISSGIKSAATFEGETLFIKGEKSDYINASNFSEIMDLFPHNHLVEIAGAGHWVHAEKPQEFVEAVEAFLK
jgi:pimeloyl-ACP methyl ester carboxylesterase